MGLGPLVNLYVCVFAPFCFALCLVDENVPTAEGLFMSFAEWVISLGMRLASPGGIMAMDES